MAKKNQYIESLRGVAVLLMVMGHVIGFDEHSGMSQDRGSFFYTLFFLLHPVRMPLFTAIAGYIYGLKTPQPEHFKSLILRKAQRLLLPMIFVGLIQRIFIYLMYGHDKDFPTILPIFYKAYQQFWFLQAAFLIFAVVIILDVLRRLNKPWVFGSLSLVSLGLCLWVPYDWTFWSFSGLASIFPAFLLGLALSRFSWQGYKVPVAALWAGAMVIYLSHRLDYFYSPEWLFRLVHVVAGLAGCYLLLQIRLHSATLIKIGAYSFGIYLFHMMVLMPIRANWVATVKGNIFAEVCYFFCAWALAVLVPIALCRIIEQSELARGLFLGEKVGYRQIFLRSRVRAPILKKPASSFWGSPEMAESRREVK